MIQSVAGCIVATPVHMQRIVITLVSLAAVLWHAHVGCCAHHEHATLKSDQPLAVAASQPHRGCPHHGHKPVSDQSSAPTHDDCHESHCHAALAASFAAPDLEPLAGWLPPLSVGDELHAALCQPSEAGRAPDERRPLPLRAHLRLAVLLI